MQKLKIYLEKVIVINFCIFLFVAPYSKHLVKVCFCIGIVGWLLLNILNYKKKFYRGIIPPNPLNKPIFFFLIASVLSVIFSSDPYHSQEIFFQRYLPYFIFFWMGVGLVIRVDKENFKLQAVSLENLYFLMSAFIISAVFFGFGSVWDYLHLHPYRIWTVFGKEVPFKMLPLYLVYYISFCFSLLLGINHKWKNAGGRSYYRLFFKAGIILSLLLLIPCWVWQGSRDAWIAGLLALLIVTFIKSRKLIPILISIFIIVFLIFPQYRLYRIERIKSIVSSSGYSDRPEIMEVAVEIFKGYPVLGAGLGMYEKLFGKYWNPPKKYKKFRYLHAHNTYLEIACEMGIVGLLAFIWIFIVFLKNAFRKIRDGSGIEKTILLGLTGTIIATLIFALAGSIILVGVQSAPLFWFLFGMASGIVSGLRREAGSTCQHLT